MKRIVLVVLFLAAAAVVVCGGFFLYMRRMPFTPAGKVLSPLWSRPALVKPGGRFEIVLKSRGGLEVERVTMQNSRFPGDLDYSAKVISVVEDKKAGTALVDVEAPLAAPEFLYDLSVWYHDAAGSGLFERQPGAVKVQMRRGGTFTFAVVTGFSFRDDLESSSGRLAKMRAFMDELDLINPDFVVDVDGAAGGIINANRDSFLLYEMKERFLDAPAFIVPNGFDVSKLSFLGAELKDGGAYWDRIFGGKRFSFDYEGFRFIGINSLSCGGAAAPLLLSGRPTVGCVGEGEFKWLEGRLEDGVKRGLQSILFLHHEPSAGVWTDNSGRGSIVFDGNSRRRLLGLCAKYGAQAVFSGFTQRDSVHWEGGTLFVTTGPGGEIGFPDRPAMRLVTVRDGRLDTRLVSYVRDPNSEPIDKVSVVFREKNDGSAKGNTVVFTNGLGRPLNNVAAVAVLKKSGDGKGYKAEGATGFEAAPGKMFDYVFVRCDLLPGEKRAVEVR